MKTVPRLKEIVTQIAQKHVVDLERPGAYLRLQMAGHGQLVIENIDAGAPGARVSVTNYIEVVHNYIADPKVVLYSASPAEADPGGSPEKAGSAWLPLEITDLFSGWRLYAEPDDEGGLLLYDPAGQAELARFCDSILARNLVNHGWLERGERRNIHLWPWSEGGIHVGAGELCERSVDDQAAPTPTVWPSPEATWLPSRVRACIHNNRSAPVLIIGGLGHRPEEIQVLNDPSQVADSLSLRPSRDMWLLFGLRHGGKIISGRANHHSCWVSST
jgi:hypothetical protein